MRKTVLLWLLLTGLLFAGGNALAGKNTVLLLLPGFPGTQSQAQPYIDKMMRFLETELGEPADSLDGLFVPDGTRAGAVLRERKPELALVGPSVYAGEHKALGMKVIARVEVQGRGEETYSVVTRTDGPASLAELAGKTVEGAIVHDSKYVHRVLLGGKLADDSLTLKSQKRPLSALRNVARGKAAGAIVDGSVIKHMSELPIGGELRVIHTSDPVPAPAVVVMGKGKLKLPRIKKALVGLCSKPEGAELCKTMTISSIKAAKDSDYKGLLKRYGK